MRHEQESNERVTNAPGGGPQSQDHIITTPPDAAWRGADDETREREPGKLIITSRLGIAVAFAAAGAIMGFAFAACGMLRGMIIPTVFAIRLHLEGAGGALLEKTVEALVEGVLFGLAMAPILALERREPLSKPHVTLRGYPRRLLRVLLPLMLAGALTFLLSEWLDVVALWTTGGPLTKRQKMVLLAAVGTSLGAGVGLLLLRFPSLVRFLPLRKRFSLQ